MNMGSLVLRHKYSLDRETLLHLIANNDGMGKLPKNPCFYFSSAVEKDHLPLDRVHRDNIVSTPMDGPPERHPGRTAYPKLILSKAIGNITSQMVVDFVDDLNSVKPWQVRQTKVFAQCELRPPPTTLAICSSTHLR